MSELQKYWLDYNNLFQTELADLNTAVYEADEVDFKIAELQERLARSEVQSKELSVLLRGLVEIYIDLLGKPKGPKHIVNQAIAALAAADGKQQCDQCEDPECPVNQRDGGEA